MTKKIRAIYIILIALYLPIFICGIYSLVKTQSIIDGIFSLLIEIIALFLPYLLLYLGLKVKKDNSVIIVFLIINIIVSFFWFVWPIINHPITTGPLTNEKN